MFLTRGLTQQTLAVKAGVSLGYLARLEVGMHDPKVNTLRKLAKALVEPEAAPTGGWGAVGELLALWALTYAFFSA